MDNTLSGISSNDEVLTSIRSAILLGIVVYMVILFSASIRHGQVLKSVWDLEAAKRLMISLRLAIIAEIVCLMILLYNSVKYGNPLPLNYSWVIRPGFSWIYDFPRPVAGILLIGVGLGSDMHRFIRCLVVVVCILQIVSDSISAIETHAYYDQMVLKEALSPHYSSDGVYQYYYRDIASIGLTTVIFCISLHMILLLGVKATPKYSYHELAGGDFDRNDVMQRERSKRAVY